MTCKNWFDKNLVLPEELAPPEPFIDPVTGAEFIPTPATANDGPGVVYFVSGAGLVKIGIARNFIQRFTALQVASPVLLIPIGFIRLPTHSERRLCELAIHNRFASSRQHGEWFLDTPELRAFMSRYAEAPL